MSLKLRVLALLQNGDEWTSQRLAYMLDMPEATIRRVVQELRADGHNISFAPYRMGV